MALFRPEGFSEPEGEAPGTQLKAMGRQEHLLGPSVQFQVGRLLLSGLVGAGLVQRAPGGAFETDGFGLARVRVWV